MPRVRLRPRLGLLGKFALASLLPIVVLGVALAHRISGQIENRALANAHQAAVLSSRLGIQPLLSRPTCGTASHPRDSPPSTRRSVRT